MGWFDDNHPMGSEADAMMADAMGHLYKWHKDPQPAGGLPELQRVEFPESEWDSTRWRKSNMKDYDFIAKGKAKSLYLLSDRELLPLKYHKEMNSAGYENMKMYKKGEVERMAWTKYGGPNGLKAAKAAKKNGMKVAPVTV